MYPKLQSTLNLSTTQHNDKNKNDHKDVQTINKKNTAWKYLEQYFYNIVKDYNVLFTLDVFDL